MACGRERPRAQRPAIAAVRLKRWLVVGLCWSCKQHSKASSAPSWVAAQALDIRKRELEAEDKEYEERLAKARKTEAHFRMLARARVTKKQVRALSIHVWAQLIYFIQVARGSQPCPRLC
jgi:hypothetical protein